MFTPRAWWFLFATLLLVAAAVITHHPVIGFLAFTLLLWFLGQWLVFAVRWRACERRFVVRRELRDERGPVNALWAGHTFAINVELHTPNRTGLAHVAVADWLPFAVEQVSGATTTDGPLRLGRPLRLSYRVRCTAVGPVRFEGVKIQIADLHGFFSHATFVSAPLIRRVLPVLADAKGHAATTKRHNLLPPPGVHRHLRAGSGSELLDLRDYLPGDPPKTIAWKISARRDKLITKEYESEVPLRCTLFVDTSNSVRVGGPGQSALTGCVQIAAAVAQANAAARDLTGMCLFDEERATRIRPARTASHVAALLNQLADAARLPPATGQARMSDLLPLGYSFAQEIYPDMLRPPLNTTPALLGWSLRGPRLFLALFVPFYALLSLVVYFLLGGRRRRLAWRKRLAAFLAAHYLLAPGGLGLLLHDDEYFLLLLQRLLAEHDVPYPLPFYDRRGRYLFAAPGKIDVLARGLVEAVSRGHDNELFVLLVDLLELTDRLEPLLRAVRVALARHHQVLVVCPWPPGMAPPEESSAASAPLGGVPDAPNAVRQLTAERFQRAFEHVRQSFARLGVSVLCARSGDPVGLILRRLERLRLAGRRR
jgi:uncharacterized protein (DUF58 family)